MSLIACTDACVYQQDGYCTLERAASCGLPGPEHACVNFAPQVLRRGWSIRFWADAGELSTRSYKTVLSAALTAVPPGPLGYCGL